MIMSIKESEIFDSWLKSIILFENADIYVMNACGWERESVGMFLWTNENNENDRSINSMRFSRGYNDETKKNSY